MTRGEAIAIVAKALDAAEWTWDPDAHKAVRLTLEALAAAGVFVDGDVVIRDQSGNGNDLVQHPTMADKLDAAGIR